MIHKMLIAAGAAFSAANAQQWTVQDGTSATTLVGVGAWSDNLAVAAASSNGVGAFIERYDGSSWKKQGGVEAGLIMDAATSDKVTVATSMLPVVLSTDGGASYTNAVGIQGLSQNANVFGEGSDIGLVGAFNTGDKTPFIYGVAHSADAGSTWSISEIPAGSVRYGAFPSSNTWYVTSGMWADVSLKNAGGHSFSSKLHLPAGANKYNFVATASHNTTLTDASGWWGTISKTSDGGKSWTPVFQSNPEDTYYFNSISCSSESHCVAVAEGDLSTDCHAFVTFDGGNTWSDTLQASGAVPSNAVSLMGASWVDDNVGWLAGTSKNGRMLSGLFYKTVDGGKTWVVEETLDDCFPIDLDFAENVGYAACINSSGSASSVAMYK